jgi:hypothetical protein
MEQVAKQKEGGREPAQPSIPALGFYRVTRGIQTQHPAIQFLDGAVVVKILSSEKVAQPNKDGRGNARIRSIVLLQLQKARRGILM